VVDTRPTAGTYLAVSALTSLVASVIASVLPPGANHVLKAMVELRTKPSKTPPLYKAKLTFQQRKIKENAHRMTARQRSVPMVFQSTGGYLSNVANGLLVRCVCSLCSLCTSLQFVCGCLCVTIELSLSVVPMPYAENTIHDLLEDRLDQPNNVVMPLHTMASVPTACHVLLRQGLVCAQVA
jgi:hypothetical protein